MSLFILRSWSNRILKYIDINIDPHKINKLDIEIDEHKIFMYSIE